MLLLLTCFSYIPDANFTDEYFLYSDASFILEFLLALLMLAFVRFSYSADSSFIEEFLLHSSC